MQERLIELGYLDDSADGVFGNNTLIAVKFFQQDAGFDVDGIASPEMQALLFSEDAPRRATPSPSPDPSATVAPTPNAGAVALRARVGWRFPKPKFPRARNHTLRCPAYDLPVNFGGALCKPCPLRR